MKILFEKIKGLAIVPTFYKRTAAAMELEFIKSRKAILKEINACKISGSALGITCSILGDGMFLTGIEDVYNNGVDYVIILKPYDMSGYCLNRNHLSLNEIRSVCPFKTLYRNPLLN
jgi:hypothetical protein